MDKEGIKINFHKGEGISSPISIIVVEHFFYWDVEGQELIRAAAEYDISIKMVILSLAAVLILIAHTLLDILSSWLNPGCAVLGVGQGGLIKYMQPYLKRKDPRKWVTPLKAFRVARERFELSAKGL